MSSNKSKKPPSKPCGVCHGTGKTFPALEETEWLLLGELSKAEREKYKRPCPQCNGTGKEPEDDPETRALIQRLLGIDISDPMIRQRAWNRIRVFQEVAAECESEGSKETAATLRKMILRVVQPDPDLLDLALLAGPEVTHADIN